ncbi:zinc finger protein 737-like isoform X1 [Sander lucioperca]|nr:zinc finger protein 737-like isoform X1 [Sander lucioperca]
MASGLMDAPAEGEALCVFLLSESAERREVGCQSDSAERREAGCQSESVERRDAAVQVDLLTQQLSWTHTGSSEMLLQCFVRPDGPGGGALLQHCTRTRTRTIKPSRRATPPTPRPNTATQRPPKRRGRRRVSPDPQQEQEEEEQEVEEEEQEVMEEDAGDPTWAPPDGDATSRPAASALEDSASQHAPVRLDSDSQDAPVRAVKLEPNSLMCDVCGKVMKNKTSLARHSFIHTGKKPFACHLCELRFNRRDNLQHHMTRLHPNGVARRQKQRVVQAWLCAVCGKTFSCRSRLKTHEVIHSGVKPHACDLCPKAYMRTNDLEHHKKIAHGNGTAEPPQPRSLLCHLCGKEFKCVSQLAAHLQAHTGERPHLCDVCGRKFARQYQLKRHKILVHASRGSGEGEESPSSSPPDAAFGCGVCGKRLKSEALLAAHSLSHSGEKPHRCAVCLRGFQTATCLKQHHMRVHVRGKASETPFAAKRRKNAAPTAAKAFPCPICSRVFKFRSLLASHSLIHSEQRPFGCDFCNRSFRRLSHLKRHREVVHANGERPPQNFVCHICGKDKKCRSQLARHIIIHTGERPFGCDLCTARFNRRGNLQQHRKRMHGVEKAAAGGEEEADEAPPILFDDDALTYKQEETVVAVDAAAEFCEAAAGDETEHDV